MIETIKYPSEKYKKYIGTIYKICEKNKFSLILKGSLSKGGSTRFSDIDLIVIGKISSEKIDEIIEGYGIPIMTNITENPKGIFIILYKNGISTDLDMRNSILEEELKDSIILLNYDLKSHIKNTEIIRKQIESRYIVKRPKWYKILRLIHRAIIKYLSYKTQIAYELLAEIKTEIINLNMSNLEFNNDFRNDIKCIFDKFCLEYKLDYEIVKVFKGLFKELEKLEVWDGYDKEEEVIGFDLVRGQAIPKGIFHLVSEIIVKHIDGEYLLTQRSFNKSNYPGKYEATAGGAVQKGENSYEAAIRELREETGIETKKLKLLYKFIDKNVTYYGYLCKTNCDKTSIILQEEETISYRWLNLEEFLKFSKDKKYVQVYRKRQKDYLESILKKEN